MLLEMTLFLFLAFEYPTMGSGSAYLWIINLKMASDACVLFRHDFRLWNPLAPFKRSLSATQRENMLNMEKHQKAGEFSEYFHSSVFKKGFLFFFLPDSLRSSLCFFFMGSWQFNLFAYIFHSFSISPFHSPTLQDMIHFIIRKIYI